MPDKYVTAECPNCGNDKARFLSMNMMGADYLCNKCGTYFDVDTYSGKCVEKRIPGIPKVGPLPPPPSMPAFDLPHGPATPFEIPQKKRYKGYLMTYYSTRRPPIYISKEGMEALLIRAPGGPWADTWETARRKINQMVREVKRR